MQYSFYNGYDIQDDNIGCGKVITVECDGTHVYSDICTLMNNCLSSIPCCITEDCVKDFLNTLSTQTVGHFVRISPTHCLEAVPINTITSDRYVGVDAGDTPGYLETKIEGCGDITVNKIGSGSNKKLEICYSGPKEITALNDTDPNLFNACVDDSYNSFIGKFLTANTTTNTVEGTCVYKPIGNIYNGADIQVGSANISKNEIKHFYIGGMGKYRADNGMVSTSNVGLPTGLGVGSTITVLKAPISGIYRVSMKGNVRVNGGIQAFRIYVASSDASLDGCVDSKFGSSDSPAQPLVRRYDQPITINTFAYFNVGGSTTVYCEAGTVFVLRLAVDSNAGTDIQPKLTLFAGGLTNGTYEPPSSVYGKIAGMSLGLEYLREANFDNKDIG